MVGGADVEPDVVAVGLPIVDVRGAHDAQRPVDLDRHPVEVARAVGLERRDVLGDQRADALFVSLGLPRRHARLGTRERLAKAIGIEGLEQVVDRLHLERAKRVAVERGDEHDRRRRLPRDRFEDAERVEIRHLDVEKEQLRLERGHLLDCLASAGARGDDFDLAGFLCQADDAPAGNGFVVGYDGGEHLRPSV